MSLSTLSTFSTSLTGRHVALGRLPRAFSGGSWGPLSGSGRPGEEEEEEELVMALLVDLRLLEAGAPRGS
jgi:hypothetical protein